VPFIEVQLRRSGSIAHRKCAVARNTKQVSSSVHWNKKLCFIFGYGSDFSQKIEMLYPQNKKFKASLNVWINGPLGETIPPLLVSD
jgi:hypothetical protein